MALFLALFGRNSNRNIYRDIQTSTTNVVNNVTNNFQKSNVNRITVAQALNVTTLPGSNILCGKFELRNSTDANIQVLSDFRAQFDTEIDNKVTEKLVTEIEKIIRQKNTGIGGGTNINSEITEAIKSSVVDINNSITNSFDQSIATGQTANQNLNVVIGGTIKGNDCLFDNTALLNILNQDIGTAVANSLASNEAFKELLSKYKLTVDQTNKGIDIGGIITTILIIIGAIILVVVIVGAIVLIVGAKSTAKIAKPF